MEKPSALNSVRLGLFFVRLPQITINALKLARQPECKSEIRRKNKRKIVHKSIVADTKKYQRILCPSLNNITRLESIALECQK